MIGIDKFSLPNRDNLMEPIHMQIPQNLNTFCGFILYFRNLCEIFEYFQKKDDAHSFFISETTACEKRG